MYRYRHAWLSRNDAALARGRNAAALACGMVLCLSFVAPVAAQDKDSLPRKELDNRVRNSLFEATKAGVALFNEQNDPAGCYQLFRGALMSVAPLLDHRPELKAAIEKGLTEAEAKRDPAERAFALRKVIDDTRKGLRPEAGPITGVPPKPNATLWDRLGGEVGVKAVVQQFIAAAKADPKVNFDRGGKVKVDEEVLTGLEKFLVAWISELSGGPLKTGLKDLKLLTQDLAITPGEYNAALNHLVTGLKAAKVDQKDIDDLLGTLAGLQKDIVADAKPPVPPPPKETLWQKLGGEEKVKLVVRDFLEAAAKDPKVNFDRNGKFVLDDKAKALLEKQILDLVSEVSGGPYKYTGKDLKKAHEGMQITDKEFNALAGHLAVTLKMHMVAQESADALMAEVGKTRKFITEAKVPTPPTTEALWKKMGGEETVKKIVHDFVELAQKDPKVNFDRGGTVKFEAADLEKLEKHFVEIISEASGGPLKYSGKDLKVLLVDLKLTQEELTAGAANLAEAMKRNKVAPELGTELFMNLGKMFDTLTKM